MNIKRLNPLDPLSHIIMIIAKEARKHPHDGQWREFKGTINQSGREYSITAKFVLRDAYFTYKDLKVKEVDRGVITLN